MKICEDNLLHFNFVKLSYNSLHISLFDKTVNEHTVSALFN